MYSLKKYLGPASFCIFFILLFDLSVLVPVEDKVRELENDFSEWLLSENPEFATSINERRYEDRLDDYSIECFDKWKVWSFFSSLIVQKIVAMTWVKLG